MALKDNLFPDLQFEEINDSPRPVQIGSINRIGLVGTFRKGPAGVFRLFSSFQQLKSIFGATAHLGSVGVQTSMEQGADDFGAIRVIGSAKRAERNIAFTTTPTPAVAASRTVTIAGTIQTGDIVTVTVGGTAVSFTITGAETTATLVATAVKNALNANSTVAAAVTATNTAGVITLTAVTAGTIGNAITLTTAVTGTTPTTTSTAGGATLTGGTNEASNVTGGNITITVATYQSNNTTLIHTTSATLTVTTGMTAAAMANAAVTLINTTSVMLSDVQAVYVSGGTVALIARTAGLASNFIKVTVSIPGSGGAVGVAPTPNTATNFTGGVDGPVKASLMVVDSAGGANLIRFDATGPGTGGNDLQVTTKPGSAAGLFNLTIVDTLTLEQEDYTDLSVATESLQIDTNQILALLGSGMVRGVFVGSNNTYTPAIITSQGLAGGADGPPVEVQDYLDALITLEESVVNYILVPGQVNNNIRAALLAQAENSTAITGYRIAILNAAKQMDIETLDTVTAAFNTTTGSGTMVAGWFTYSGQPRMSRFSVSPDAAYAGHLVVTPSQVSPAARSSSPFFRGVLEVDTKSTEQAFNAYTKARMEALIVDPATGGVHCLNGRTLSSDGAWYWISVRRVYNQIKSDLFRMTQWVKSQPNTSSLRLQLAQQLDGYMETLLSRGTIANTQKSVVDSTNNPLARIASGFLRAEVYFVPVFPADHVVFGVHRYLAADVLVQAG